jgi:predicted O-methyltransferase YrrM
LTPTFTTDWFTRAIPEWQEHVVPRIAKIPDAKWLEIGCYEGRSTLWTLENVLRGPRSSITCVDPWCSYYAKNLASNLAGIDRITHLKGKSLNILPSVPSESFHGAYIDGSHIEPDISFDLQEGWRLLKPGAILIIDDYGLPGEPGEGQVKQATDAFLRKHESHLKILSKKYQVILLKDPIPRS